MPHNGLRGRGHCKWIEWLLFYWIYQYVTAIEIRYDCIPLYWIQPRHFVYRQRHIQKIFRRWLPISNALQTSCLSVASIMPSISPVHSLSSDHDKESKEEDDQTSEISGHLKSRFSPSSTFSERLKAARKLIPSYPGKAKLVRSVSESSTLTTKTDEERIHIRAENESCATSQDFGTFFREHAIMVE